MKNMANINSQRNLTVTLAAASLVLLIGSLCPAAVIPVFECDFEGGPVPEISGAGQIVGTQGFGPFGMDNWFLQNVTGGIPQGTEGDPTVLTLSGLPFHTHIEIRMHLAIIDSWDGDYVEGPDPIFNPDYFNVTVDGQVAFRETISSWGDSQSFTPKPEQIIVLGEMLFVDPPSEWPDSLYAMGPSLENIPHSGSDLVVTFHADGGGWQGLGWEGGSDESFAIDNIEIVLFIEVPIEIKPETLNLKSKGVFTAFIDIPEEFDEEDIDISTVVCEGAPAIHAEIADNGRLVVKFNREDLVGVSTGDAVELTVTGQLTNGTAFAGSDTIRVIDRGGKK